MRGSVGEVALKQGSFAFVKRLSLPLGYALLVWFWLPSLTTLGFSSSNLTALLHLAS